MFYDESKIEHVAVVYQTETNYFVDRISRYGTPRHVIEQIESGTAVIKHRTTWN